MSNFDQLDQYVALGNRTLKMVHGALGFARLALQAALIGISMVLLLVPPSIILNYVTPSRRVRYFGPIWQIWSKFILSFVVGARVTAIDRRKNFNNIFGRGLYISNHLSMADIPLLSYHNVAIPMMKKEVAEIPLFGKIIQIVNPIIVDRRDSFSRNRAFKECMRRLSTGSSVQYYPEGTRSKTGRPKEFSEIHSRLIENAYELGTCITPISVFGTTYIIGANGDLRSGQNVGIITHEEMWPDQFASKDEFAHAVWNQVISGFNELEALLPANPPPAKT